MGITTAQRKLIWLSLFAIAMANVEAALVVHLRSLYYPENPLAIFPLNLLSHRDLAIELTRELATVIMITSVALLTEKGLMRNFAAFVFVFGLWDIFYYAWLKVMIGWPVNWLEWDVLFLIPWPWLGPWICPALIALLFVLWGSRILLSPVDYSFSRINMGLFLLGTALCLFAFLLPAAVLLPGGEAAFPDYQPSGFSWWLFFGGYLLMMTGLLRVLTAGQACER